MMRRSEASCVLTRRLSYRSSAHSLMCGPLGGGSRRPAFFYRQPRSSSPQPTAHCSSFFPVPEGAAHYQTSKCVLLCGAVFDLPAMCEQKRDFRLATLASAPACANCRARSAKALSGTGKAQMHYKRGATRRRWGRGTLYNGEGFHVRARSAAVTAQSPGREELHPRCSAYRLSGGHDTTRSLSAGRSRSPRHHGSVHALRPDTGRPVFGSAFQGPRASRASE
jgi:hypothetical protein